MNLRVIYLLAISFVCFTTSVVSAYGMGAGIKVGFNQSRMWGVTEGEHYDDMFMLPGFIAGGMFQHKLSKLFAIQPELLYTVKGKKVTGVMDYSPYLSEYSYHDYVLQIRTKYLEIPILMQFTIPASEALMLMLYTGPAFSFKLGTDLKEVIGGNDVNFSKDDIKNENNMTDAIDFGLVMGCGFGIKAGPGRIIIDTRCTLGFTNTKKVFYSGTERNIALSFMAGYMFEF
jgi:hypothetical protein